MAALARLAKTGVLVKRGLALEQLAAVKRIVFDKTGTLTTAQMSVGRIISLQPGWSEDRLLQLAANLEQASERVEQTYALSRWAERVYAAFSEIL